MTAPIVKCPTCQRAVTWTADSRWRPFCSERCKMVDLGAWFSEGRAIPGDAAAEPGDADVLETLQKPDRDERF